MARRVRGVDAMRYRRLSTRLVSLRSLPEISDLLDDRAMHILVGPARWQPPADVFESTEAITVNVELAGVDEDDLEVQLHADALVVEGHKRPPPAPADAVYHQAAIRHGRFRLEIRLPGRVDSDAIEGVYERGLLTLTLPKRTSRVHVRPRTEGASEGAAGRAER